MTAAAFPPSAITPLLREHHQDCDLLFANAEEQAQQGNWAACATATLALSQALEEHFRGEEELLFPAFEAATGMRDGPTAVMRYEHSQMRPLLGMLHDALAQRDASAYGDAAATLLVLLQQHNLKEENILYPLCDQHIADLPELCAQLRQRLDHPTP